MVRRVAYRARALYVTQMLVFLGLVAAIELHVRGSGRWDMSLLTIEPMGGDRVRRNSALRTLVPRHPAHLHRVSRLTPIVLLQFDKGNIRRVLALSALLWVVSGLLIRSPEQPERCRFRAIQPARVPVRFHLGLGVRHETAEHRTAFARDAATIGGRRSCCNCTSSSSWPRLGTQGGHHPDRGRRQGRERCGVRRLVKGRRRCPPRRSR